MGLMGWLFPSPEQKLERARAKLARGRYAEARLDALDLGQLRGADEVVALAEEALARMNIEAAVSWAHAGDPERVHAHLELAQAFRTPELEPALKDAVLRIREIDAERKRAAAVQAEEEARRLLHVDLRFREEHGEDELPLPEGVGEDEAEAVKVRLALALDAWPEHLRPGMVALGASYAKAVLDLEDGRPEEALKELLALPDDSPLVLHERARAAYGLRDPAAAARSWRAFAEAAGGHQLIGEAHTGVLLARAQAESGDTDAALGTLSDLRRGGEHRGDVMYAQLLEGRGRLADAEQVLRSVLKKRGAHPRIYEGIARLRVKGGHRVPAMQALEKAIEACGCGTGRCGTFPPDLPIYRMLSTLYLEDGVETARGLELAGQAAALVQQPSWEDAYLAALAARAREEARWSQLAASLREVTPAEDPRHALLEQHLAV